MRKPLNVFYERKLVGTLLHNPDDTISFQYSENWLRTDHSFPLSPSVPLQKEPFNNRQTKAYFDNLLPEGEFLKTLEKTLKRSVQDPYHFLEAYGLDCAGAMEITPLAEPPEPSGQGRLEKLSFDEIDSVLEEGRTLYVHSLTAHPGKFSIAGAQDKIPVVFRQGEVFIPIDSTPTTHILKPPAKLPSVVDTVQNEYLCMRLAQDCGLEVPNVKIVGKRTPLFLVERYDREMVGGEIHRVHQFDLCQAQGFPASEKYEEDGGPSYAQNYHAVENISDQKIRDLESVLNWLAFNLLIGNNDSHSKNLSLIYRDGSTRIAPFYDLLSTSLYKDLSPEFAFSIGGQRRWHLLKRNHFKALSKELGFVKREEIVVDHILALAKKIESASAKLFAHAKEAFPESPISAKLSREIERRINGFRQKLK